GIGRGGGSGRRASAGRGKGARRRRPDALDELPGNRFAGAQRNQLIRAERQALRRAPLLPGEGDALLVRRQAVEARAELGSEGFQLVERAGFLEGGGVELDRGMRRVDAGAAAGRLLVLARMRRAVGAEE